MVISYICQVAVGNKLSPATLVTLYGLLQLQNIFNVEIQLLSLVLEQNKRDPLPTHPLFSYIHFKCD